MRKLDEQTQILAGERVDTVNGALCEKSVSEFFFIYNNYIIINQNYVRDNNHLDRKRDLDLRFE